MRLNKLLTIITLLFSIVSILLFMFLYSRPIIKEISIAVFGSALMGFIMSLTSFFPARKAAMESFYVASVKDVGLLNGIKYLWFSDPIDLVHDMLIEAESPDYIEYYCILNKKAKPKERFKEYMSSSGIKLSTDDQLNALYDVKCEQYKEEVIQCMKSYIPVKDIDISKLDSAFGELNFLFKNTEKRDLAYNSIYKPIDEYRKDIVEKIFHFNLYFDGEGSLSRCFSFLLELNKICFDIQRVEEDDYAVCKVYNNRINSIIDSLEIFRRSIYKNSKEEIIEHEPIAGWYEKSQCKDQHS